MLKPLGDRIVIKVIEDTEQTSGGIFIPDRKSHQQKMEMRKHRQPKLSANPVSSIEVSMYLFRRLI